MDRDMVPTHVTSSFYVPYLLGMCTCVQMAMIFFIDD